MKFATLLTVLFACFAVEADAFEFTPQPILTCYPEKLYQGETLTLK